MNLISCVNQNWGIGKNNRLLFSLPEDMRFFRDKTIGKTVVMGSQTFRSLPNGKPLPNRENLVLSTTLSSGRGFTVFSTIEELLRVISTRDRTSVFVIGGEAVYKSLLPYCERAYITKVSMSVPADRFFPNLDREPNWRIASVTQANTIGISFVQYAKFTS